MYAPIIKPPFGFKVSWNISEYPTPASKFIHLFPSSLSCLCSQLAPSEPVGKFENLPDPSCHDWDTGNDCKFNIFVKFLCSVEYNCILHEVFKLNVEDPIVSLITSVTSLVGNLIRTLDG